MKQPTLIVALVIAAMVVVVACAPNEAEIRAIVQAEVAKIEVPAGPQGLAGPPGERGQPGLQGQRGDPGLPGKTGLAGPKGETGLPGDRGEVGLMGKTGPQGEPGRTGDRGLRGEIGPRGEPGVTGNRGDSGLRGDVGPQGERGPPGETGPAAEIPASLEVEQLTVRIPDAGGYLVLKGGPVGYVADITWYSSEGETGGHIWAGSSNGMVLYTLDGDGDSETEFCLHEGRIGPCP